MKRHDHGNELKNEKRGANENKHEVWEKVGKTPTCVTFSRHLLSTQERGDTCRAFRKGEAGGSEIVRKPKRGVKTTGLTGKLC